MNSGACKLRWKYFLLFTTDLASPFNRLSPGCWAFAKSRRLSGHLVYEHTGQ